MRTHRIVSYTLGICLSALAPNAVAQHGAPHGHGPAVVPAHAPGAAVLRMTYQPGQTVRYVMHGVQQAPPPVGEMHSTSHIEISTVSVRPDGAAQLRMRVTGMELQGASVTDAARQQIQRGVANMSMTYTQDQRGHISDRAAPSGVSPEFQPLIEGMLQSLDQMSPELPEGAVAVGDHWTEHRPMHLSVGPSVAIDMDIDVTYTLAAAVPGTSAMLNIQMTLGMSHPATAGGATITAHGTGTGSIGLDLAHGVLDSSHSTGEMNMHLVAANGRPADVHFTYTNEMTRDGAAATTAAAPPAAH